MLVGKVLASSQSEVVAPPPEPAKKGKKPEDEDEDPVPASALPGETKTIMTLPEMFRHEAFIVHFHYDHDVPICGFYFSQHTSLRLTPPGTQDT